jgi:hypothetical protein
MAQIQTVISIAKVHLFEDPLGLAVCVLNDSLREPPISKQVGESCFLSTIMIGVQLGLLLGALDGVRTMADVSSDG